MYNFIDKLDLETTINLINKYSEVKFTKSELEPIFPFLKSNYKIYLEDKNKKDALLNELKSIASKETYQKIMYLKNKYDY